MMFSTAIGLTALIFLVTGCGGGAGGSELQGLVDGYIQVLETMETTCGTSALAQVVGQIEELESFIEENGLDGAGKLKTVLQRAEMQSFADGAIGVVEKLESRPEVAQAGQQANLAYMESGYTDLESAETARSAFEQSSQNDQEALKDLETLNKPDKESQQIATELGEGVEKVDEGNRAFADGLAKAKDQTVEERAATAQNIGPAMGMYAEGMGKIVDSLEKLEEYVRTNGLDGIDKVQQWLERIKGELQMVESYTS